MNLTFSYVAMRCPPSKYQNITICEGPKLLHILDIFFGFAVVETKMKILPILVLQTNNEV
jgi:hypothetical protein